MPLRADFIECSVKKASKAVFSFGNFGQFFHIYLLPIVVTYCMSIKTAKFQLGAIVRHRLFPFRGVIFDVDPEFSNTDEWWESIPKDVRPRKDQPFYHLLAENEDTSYIAYVSEQNLLMDETGKPVSHPRVGEFFTHKEDGRYVVRETYTN